MPGDGYLQKDTQEGLNDWARFDNSLDAIKFLSPWKDRPDPLDETENKQFSQGNKVFPTVTLTSLLEPD